jgi:hypothetical protein
MVNHELRRKERIDLLRISAHRGHLIPHGRQVDYCRHASEVLQHHARGIERDLGPSWSRRIPIEDLLDVASPHGLAVLVAEQVLEQDAQSEGQSQNIATRHGGQAWQAEVRVDAIADRERLAHTEGVEARFCHGPPLA